MKRRAIIPALIYELISKFDFIRLTLDRGVMKHVGKTVKNIHFQFSEYLIPDHRYTYVLTDDKVILALTDPNNVALNNLSKHAMLAPDGKVRMAGELWVDAKGVLHINNASGTFRPKADLLEPSARFFREHFNLDHVEFHPR